MTWPTDPRTDPRKDRHRHRYRHRNGHQHWHRGTALLAVALAWHLLLAATRPTTATAQDTSAIDIPVIGRPGENFYGAVGAGVKVAWRLDRPGDPAEVTEGSEFLATLVVSGVTNPLKITRPDLKTLPEFQERFVVTDEPDPPADAASREVSFRYRLRPRNRGVTELPALEFYYFNPSAAEGKQFKLTAARPVRLRVVAAPERPPDPPVPLPEPEHLLAITTGPAVLTPPGFAFASGSGAWLGLALAGPTLALVWYGIWCRLNPTGQRLARVRRSRAARRAAKAVASAAHSADPPAALAAALLDYLRDRYALPPGAVTAGEVETALYEAGVPKPDGAAVAAFLRSCDAARFAPVSATEPSLTDAAIALLARLEAT